MIKSDILDVLSGKKTKTIPWVPRLDLWYYANKRAGTLPVKYKDASLMEITEDLGVGFHSVIPAFKEYKDPAEEIHRALGIHNLWFVPFKTILNGVEVKVTEQGDEKTVEYNTPKGNIRTKVLYNEDMKAAGISITHISEYAFKSEKDYPALEYIFRNAEVKENYAGYDELAGWIGGCGIAVALLNMAGSPMHQIQREFMPMDQFFYEHSDHPGEMNGLAEAMGSYYDKALEVAAGSSAEVVLFGANYDASLTVPPFFRDHILPWLKKASKKLHSKGKYLLSHTDGENTGLLEYYLESGMDIADSICPDPMTKLTMKQVRDRFNGRLSIMGGIPSVILLKETMSDRDFEAYLDKFMGELGEGDHIILGISDTTPPGADLERIKLIGKKIKFRR